MVAGQEQQLADGAEVVGGVAEGREGARDVALAVPALPLPPVRVVGRRHARPRRPFTTHAHWLEIGWALRAGYWGRGYATEIGHAGLARDWGRDVPDSH